MLNQTCHSVLDEMGLVEAYHKLLLSCNVQWEGVGIFIDGKAGRQKSFLIVLLEEQKIVAIFRVCLDTPENTIKGISLFLHKIDQPIVFRSYQGELFRIDQIRSLSQLNQLWDCSENQSIQLDSRLQAEIIYKIFNGIREKGRGKDFSTATKRQVNIDAYGRCMFEGCGVNLRSDGLSGESGNYGYLAHNVASSENGPRGIPGVSDVLSDDPSNILFLCDKHHRLIDKVAAVDYPAHRLSKMRADFCTTAGSLLDGLSCEPVPAISVSWPVQRTAISSPTNLQIAQSLAKMNWRMASGLQSPCGDSDALFRNLPPDQTRFLWPNVINDAAEKVTSSLNFNRYRAALFAFGPMPALIALGAKIGNKQEIIPMLRYRDGNQWVWPADEPQGQCYNIYGIEDLSENDEDIIITLSFTNKPSQFSEFIENTGFKSVRIETNADAMGNGSIGHPLDGIAFMDCMQRLLHELNDRYDVKRVHLLPCASNAVCVFFGKAFDLHHPEIIVYDFGDKTMVPSLKIKNENSQCKIELAETTEQIEAREAAS